MRSSNGLVEALPINKTTPLRWAEGLHKELNSVFTLGLGLEEGLLVGLVRIAPNHQSLRVNP